VVVVVAMDVEEVLIILVAVVAMVQTLMQVAEEEEDLVTMVAVVEVEGVAIGCVLIQDVETITMHGEDHAIGARHHDQVALHPQVIEEAMVAEVEVSLRKKEIGYVQIQDVVM